MVARVSTDRIKRTILFAYLLIKTTATFISLNFNRIKGNIMLCLQGRHDLLTLEITTNDAASGKSIFVCIPICDILVHISRKRCRNRISVQLFEPDL